MNAAPTFRAASVLAVAAASLLVSCAHQIPPQGGPLDVEGPRIVGTWPAPFTTRFREDRVEFEFDEYVDQRSFEESVFIAPAIQDVEFDWSGKSVAVVFHEPLRDSTTYVLTVGTDVVDLERSRPNRMDQSFTLAFSTGDHIDRGLLSGRVFPRTPGDETSGVLVLAYRTDGMVRDTLDPGHTLPDYVTQTGASGRFVLPHIRLGTYFVMAERDEYRNITYDRTIDEFGLPTGYATLTESDTARTGILLTLAREDTLGPRLVKVEPKDRNHLAIEFSEPVDTAAGTAPAVSVVDTLSGKEVTVFAVVVTEPAAKSATVVTDFLEPRRGYALSLTAARDLSGNPVDRAQAPRAFEGPETRDTTRPRFAVVSVKDSARGVARDVEIHYTSSEPLQRDDITASRFAWNDAQGRSVGLEVRLASPVTVVVRPTHPLEGISWYAVEFRAFGVKDWKNDSVLDSVIVRRFETEDPEDAGSIEGVVHDATPGDTTGTIVVEAFSTDVKPPVKFRTVATRARDFRVGGLAAGKYVLGVFHDRNSNGVLDPGTVLPFHPAERRSDLTDTLKVRARWPLEGVVLTLPRP